MAVAQQGEKQNENGLMQVAIRLKTKVAIRLKTKVAIRLKTPLSARIRRYKDTDSRTEKTQLNK